MFWVDFGETILDPSQFTKSLLSEDCLNSLVGFPGRGRRCRVWDEHHQATGKRGHPALMFFVSPGPKPCQPGVALAYHLGVSLQCQVCHGIHVLNPVYLKLSGQK